jgi:O-antigen/teichoic acid export membrane protein
MRSLRAWRQDKLLRTVLENSGYLFSSNSATLVLSMAQSIFAARLLGPEQFGLLSATVIPFVSTVNRLTSFRMSELVVAYTGRYLAEGRQEQAAAVTKGAALVDILASVLGFLILLAAAPLGATYLAKNSASGPLFITYGLVLLANATFETATGVLQVANRFRTIAIINLIQSLVTAGMIFAAYLAGRGLLEVLLAYLAGKTFAGLATSALAFFELRKTLGPGWWRASLRLGLDWAALRRFAFSTNLNGTLNLITRDSETLWISFLRNPLEAGYYKIALGVINLVMLPVQPLIGTTYTETARTLAQRSWQATTDLLRRVSTLAGLWTVAAAAGLAVFGNWVISQLYGGEYAPAYPALLILLVGYGFANILYWNRPLLLALGLPTYPLKVAALFGALKTALALWLVPQYGYLAEAALMTAFFLTTISANVRRGLQEIGVRRRAPQLAESRVP